MAATGFYTWAAFASPPPLVLLRDLLPALFAGEAGAVGIIGVANGPTAVFTVSRASLVFSQAFALSPFLTLYIIWAALCVRTGGKRTPGFYRKRKK